RLKQCRLPAAATAVTVISLDRSIDRSAACLLPRQAGGLQKEASLQAQNDTKPASPSRPPPTAYHHCPPVAQRQRLGRGGAGWASCCGKIRPPSTLMMDAMEAAAQQGPDRMATNEPVETPGTLTSNEGKTSTSENFKEHIPLTKDRKIVSVSASCDVTSVDPPKVATGPLETFDAGPDRNAIYQSNVYAPQAQAVYYGGYENPPGMWDDYLRFVSHEGIEIGSHGTPPLVFHTGYGYSPQIPCGPFSPATTPLPSVRGDSQVFSVQQFPSTGPYLQQPSPNTVSILNSPAPMSHANLTMPVGVERRGSFLTDQNSNGMLFGPRPCYPISYGSSVRGNISSNSGNSNFYDLRQGFDGFGSGGHWSDWLKSPDGQRSLTPFSPATSPQPIGGLGTFTRSVSPFSSGMGSLHQRPYAGGYSYGGMYHQSANFAVNMGNNGWGFAGIDRGRRRGKSSAPVCSCTGTIDFLSEQNRGPRASKSKNLAMEQNSLIDNNSLASTAGVCKESYNKPDFVTEYKDAKFFIIKSYSEDNVHKSIKYGVWASTPNGNRKLDSAYSETREKGVKCPIFLFFSVNASAHFCGVTEMVGPVDFEKNADYWQQDKWSGQFPVKWYIVKDVPNSMFRHIILENNDNKPVTNSRDTQEVKLEQGLEMLNIFKKHEADMSILDDFAFYEERQKAMVERKARQQQQQ
ncbi:hypothetical protein Taro_006306, partial [Colocasia esculenta]|nr:hypothetical protein [Colocasia esculenta]